ncbi:MAG TPA: hypothetical protein VFS13_00725 [Steroidobacteraceae bacterium]|nr:hypothetical protein [Steroidobacteraceae bacterium]
MNLESVAMVLVAALLAFVGGYLADRYYAKKWPMRRTRVVSRGERSITYIEEEPLPAFLARVSMLYGFWAGLTMLAIFSAYYLHLAMQQAPCADAEQRQTDQVEHGADKARVAWVPADFERVAHVRLQPRLQGVIAPLADAEEERAKPHEGNGSIGNLKGHREGREERGAAKPAHGLVPMVELQLLHHAHAAAPRLAHDCSERSA